MGGRFSRHDTLEAQTVEKYIQTNKRHKRALEAQLKATGVTDVHRSQHQLLMYVAENPKASQKELARLQHVSTATIAVSLKKLEQGGYLKREVDSRDNRYNQIEITGKGMDVVEKSIRVFDQMEKAMFRGFSEEDFQILGRLLDRIYDNLEEYTKQKERISK